MHSELKATALLSLALTSLSLKFQSFGIAVSFPCTVQTKIFKFVNLSLFLHDVPIFWLENLHIMPQTSEISLEGASTLVKN